MTREPRESETEVDGARRKESKDDQAYRRLPKCVIPLNYQLTLQPDENEPVIDGKMTIRVQVMCECNEIILNGLNINVTSAFFRVDSSKDKTEAKDIFVQNEKEIIQIEFPSVLTPGIGFLSLDFDSQINSHTKGAFRCKVTGKNGQPRYNFFTHFEPVSARRCFPCFDEPMFKATFDISLIVKKDLTALSNMPVEEEKPHEKNEDLVVHKFKTTPKMSTYLIAFVIGEFDKVEKHDSDGVLVRVFTPLGKQKQGEFSLELAANALPYYNEYFGIPYPLPKCDLVAAQDFDGGAMENYGLVIFRDTRLLVDAQETSALSKQYTSLVVAHELAHKWFGNLVTMKFWDDLWLKEGFANFIQNLCVDNFYPDFDCWTQFVTDNTFSGMLTDALKNSHPIEVPVTNPSEIENIFDNITYDKGSSIIRMMYNFIGDSDFRGGMNKYLTKFQYSNAETLDLWDALGEASGRPVGLMMDTFTKQMGFPLVTVTKVENVEDKNSDSQMCRIFTLKQEKFWADLKLYTDVKNSTYRWIIPLTFCKGSKPREIAHEVLFDGRQSDTLRVVVPNVAKDEWVKINAGVVGYYRVRYPPAVLAEFADAIKKKTMGPADRAGLLSDLQATVKCGQTPAADILNLLTAFTNEDNYIVWTTIRNIVMDIHDLILRTEHIDKFKTFAISLFKPLKNAVGWDPLPEEEHKMALLRSLVMDRLVSLGDQDIIKEAKDRFEQHVAGEKMISADLRVSAYKARLTSDGDAGLELMLNIFRESEMSEEKVRILHSLGAITSKPLLEKVLAFGISDDVKSSMLISILFSLSATKEGQDLIWQFFKDNVKLFQERYPGGFQIVRAVEMVTEHFATEELAVEVESFFKANPCRGTERTVQQVVENIRINADWLARDLNGIAGFLESQ